MTSSIFDKLSIPPSAKHLGFKVIDEDRVHSLIRVEFHARKEFLNPAGVVQGGYITAMLDETMGPALVVATDGVYAPSTIDMNVTFLEPAKLGRFIGEGRVIKHGKTIAFLEAQLEDENGTLIAKASSRARLFRL